MEEKNQETKNDEIDLSGVFNTKGIRAKLENWSFIVTVISGLMVAVGIGLGSFIQGSIFIASFGSFFFMFGVIIFIISQFFEEVK